MSQNSSPQQAYDATLFTKDILHSPHSSQAILDKAAAVVVNTFAPLSELREDVCKAECAYNRLVEKAGGDAEKTKKAKADYESKKETFTNANFQNVFAQNILEFLYQYITIHQFILADPRMLSNMSTIYTDEMVDDLAFRRSWSSTERVEIFRERIAKLLDEPTFQNACNCASCPIDALTISELETNESNLLLEQLSTLTAYFVTFIE
jgi:hypothetical protein